MEFTSVIFLPFELEIFVSRPKMQNLVSNFTKNGKKINHWIVSFFFKNDSFPDLFCFICINGVCKGPNPKKKVEEKDKKGKLKLKRKLLNRTNLSWSTVLNHDLKSSDQDSLSRSRGTQWECVCATVALLCISPFLGMF